MAKSKAKAKRAKKTQPVPEPVAPVSERIADYYGKRVTLDRHPDVTFILVGEKCEVEQWTYMCARANADPESRRGRQWVSAESFEIAETE